MNPASVGDGLQGPKVLSKLAEHPLASFLMDKSKPALVRATREMQKTKATRPSAEVLKQFGSAEEEYYVSVFYHVGKLFGAFERVTHVEALIRMYPMPKTLTASGVTRDKWLEYHYAVFLITTVGIEDLALLLINEACVLNIASRAIGYKKVLGQPMVNRSGLKRKLDNLHTIIQAFRDHRNEHVHHGESIPLHEIMSSKNYDSLKLIQMAMTHGDDMDVNPRMLEYMFKNEASKLQSMVAAHRAELVDSVADLFDSVLEVVKLVGPAVVRSN
jgi:hypothetical protein